RPAPRGASHAAKRRRRWCAANLPSALAGEVLLRDRVAWQQRADPPVQPLAALHPPRAQLALDGEARLDRDRARALVAVERDPLDALQAQLREPPAADRAHRLERVALPACLGRGP